MWEAIQYVTSALTLVAFIAATAAYAYGRRVASREKQIAAAPEDARAGLIRDTLEFFDVDTANLTKERQYQIALEQIRARSRRFLTSAIIGGVLCLAFFGLAAYAISRATPTTAIGSIETYRNVAFLLGYDGAITLARSRMGKNIDQERAAQDQRLRLLGIEKITYPVNPLGESNDAAPAAEFARRVSGALEARDPRLAKAFQLGWVGVISTNTPSLSFPGFSVQAFAREAGFPTSAAASDVAVLEQIASAARGAK